MLDTCLQSSVAEPGDAARAYALTSSTRKSGGCTKSPGDRFSQTFDQPGTFDYFCEFHANMMGTVIVQ